MTCKGFSCWSCCYMGMYCQNLSMHSLQFKHHCPMIRSSFLFRTSAYGLCNRSSKREKCHKQQFKYKPADPEFMELLLLSIVLFSTVVLSNWNRASFPYTFAISPYISSRAWQNGDVTRRPDQCAVPRNGGAA